MTGAHSKAESVLEVFLPLVIESVQTVSSAVLTWHPVPSTVSPCIPPYSWQSSVVQEVKDLPPSFHPLLQYFLLNCCGILFVCWLIILILLSCFGFNLPFCVSSEYSEPEELPQCVWRGGYFQSTVHIGWNSVSIEIWWQSSHLLQWGQIFISGTWPVLFFLFLCVCSTDISSSLPPFFFPCSWKDNVFHGTLGDVVYYEHLDGTSFGAPSLGFLAKPSISCVVALST